VKRRNKILIGIGGFFVVAIGTVMSVTAYDSACPAAEPVGEASADSMRAIVHRCYRIPEGLALVRKPIPKPEAGQVLIKVRASSVNPAEWYGASGQPRLIRLSGGIGLPNDDLIGFDMAGVVEAVGPGVTRFQPGDEVFGGVGRAYSEYVIGREQGAIVKKPENMTFDEAAAIPIAAITALQGLRDNGRLAAGQKVLINGASGGVGTYAVQIAKAMGAEVTAVCSGRNVEMVRSLGADQVIDYTQEDFTKADTRYDVILDNVGNHGYFALARVTTPSGQIVSVGGSKANPWMGPITRVFLVRPMVKPFVDPNLTFFIARVNKEDLEVLAGWAREGKLRSIIDRRYPLEQVGAALEYLGTQRAKGKVVVTIN
jgi:NADPH:quinone reductase-like Zn-dependent oxidoreductase